MSTESERTAPPAESSTRRPAADIRLNPAVRVLWRSHDQVQLEIGGAAYVVTGVDTALLAELTGRGAQGTPLPNDLVRALHSTQLAWPVPAEHGRPPEPRLADELTSLTARLGRRAVKTLRTRRERCVEVIGPSRTGIQVAAVLAAAGIGRVYVSHPNNATLHQTGPGALAAGDEGRVLVEAAAEVIKRAAPEVDTTPLARDRSPDLVVLAFDSPTHSDVRDVMHLQRQPYLATRVGPGFGTVGPFVVPTQTSCLRCADLHRQDRDPAWSALAVQLTVPPRYGVPSEIAVTTTIAGMTAIQVLAYLDGEVPATFNGTLELHLPDWRIRRRSWPIHPDCGCVG